MSAVPDRFEVVGAIEALEQRRSKSGAPITGLWAVRLRTEGDIRTASFNSTIPVDWDNPQGERRPHPDFAILQEAMGAQKTVRIRGTVVQKGDRTFFNGTRAELVDDTEGTRKTSQRRAPSNDAPTVDMEDAKWAVSVAADAVSLDDPEAIEEVRSMAAALLLVAQELSREGVEGIAREASVPENVHELAQKRKRA
jgi:hypothetical protein